MTSSFVAHFVLCRAYAQLVEDFPQHADKARFMLLHDADYFILMKVVALKSVLLHRKDLEALINAMEIISYISASDDPMIIGYRVTEESFMSLVQPWLDVIMHSNDLCDKALARLEE